MNTISDFLCYFLCYFAQHSVTVGVFNDRRLFVLVCPIIFPTMVLQPHHSFELNHQVQLSKFLCGIFHFWLCFLFIKVCNFVQQNAWTQNTIIPFKVKTIKKAYWVLFLDLWFLNCSKRFRIQWYLRKLEQPKN